MSGANFMNKLLVGVTVEWKALGTVIKTVTAPAKLKSESYRTKGRLPIVDQGIEFIAGFTDEDVTPVEAGEYVIFGDHSEHIKYVDFPFIQGADGLKILRPISANAKYIYHAFLNFYTKELNYKRHWSTAQQTLIPIPCPGNPQKSLEIQAEIVRILDAFTELTAELTTELTTRKKQYSYYRDQLLGFEVGGVEWKTLGEIVSTITTGKLNANAMTEGGAYPFFTCDANPFRIDTFAFDTEAIIVSGNGSHVGHINYYKGKFNAYQRTYVLADCAQEITMGFLLAHLKAYLRPYIIQHSKKGSVPYITMPILHNFKVPVPSLDRQLEITSILDKFDALTTSLTEGLPREIELRQKQYEYYCEMLLTFPKPDGVEA